MSFIFLCKFLKTELLELSQSLLLEILLRVVRRRLTFRRCRQPTHCRHRPKERLNLTSGRFDFGHFDFGHFDFGHFDFGHFDFRHFDSVFSFCSKII